MHPRGTHRRGDPTWSSPQVPCPPRSAADRGREAAGSKASTLGGEVSDDATQGGPEGIHDDRNRSGTERPSASPCSAPGRSRNQARRRRSSASSSASGCSRRSRSRCTSMPNSQRSMHSLSLSATVNSRSFVMGIELTDSGYSIRHPAPPRATRAGGSATPSGNQESCGFGADPRALPTVPPPAPPGGVRAGPVGYARRQPGAALRPASRCRQAWTSRTTCWSDSRARRAGLTARR